MKRFKILTTLLSSILLIGVAQATDVCGDVSGVWDLEGSPYLVTCDVTVQEGDSLAIDPGVIVEFSGPYPVRIYGTLLAIGTATDSIVFTTDTSANPLRWPGFRFSGNSSSGSELTYCVIKNGYADTLVYAGGGGIYCESSSPTVGNCSIVNCLAGTGGGAFLREVGSTPSFTDCAFVGNMSFGSGGGLSCIINSAPVFRRCVFMGNIGAAGGAIFTRNDALLNMVNCTIVENTALNNGGGLYNRSGTTTTILSNCIFWGNSSPSVNEIFILNGGVDATYSNISGGYAGVGNINSDPQFVNAVGGDFHLQEGSPCIDAGDPILSDSDSTRRDMGAFYFPQPNLLIQPLTFDFGVVDFGSDPYFTVYLQNASILLIPVPLVSVGTPSFVFDTTGLNGQVNPNSTFELDVTFSPAEIGYYEDTLVIVAERLGDDTVRIPLSGDARILLPPLDSLVISWQPGDILRLEWPPITHTISGQPFIPPRYNIYSSVFSDGPYSHLTYTTTNSYSTPFFFPLFDAYFFRVTAETE